MIKFNSKLLRYLCYWIIPLISAAALAIAHFIGPLAFYETSGFFGNAAIYMFILVMFVKPLAVITRQKIFTYLVGQRKPLGILTFYFAFLHGLAELIFNDYLTIESLSSGIQNNIFIAFGLAAFVLVFILYITSNQKSVILLKKKWKLLHRICAYSAFTLVIFHIGLFTQDINWYVWLGTYWILKIIEFNREWCFRKFNHLRF